MTNGKNSEHKKIDSKHECSLQLPLKKFTSKLHSTNEEVKNENDSLMIQWSPTLRKISHA